MMRASRKLRRRAICAISAATLSCLATASVCQAADSVYWLNVATGTISHANLAGGGGSQVPISGTPVKAPAGLAIDAATGRLYWTNQDLNSIGHASLDGSGGGTLAAPGALFETPTGLAIDPTARRLFWGTNGASDAISFASLDAPVGGQFDTTGATVQSVASVAVFPAAGKIYWANNKELHFASLGGGGGGTLGTGGVPIKDIEGIAIDASSRRIFWTDASADTIGFAGLDGGPSGTLNTGAATVDEPVGLAIDPGAGRVYWANFGDNTIRFADLSGSGAGGQVDITGTTPRLPGNPVLLRAPQAAPAAPMNGAAKAGTGLPCLLSWLGDLPESFLYRAPQSVSHQWLRNGQPVPGATGKTIVARRAGSYSCQTTATNFAGSTTQTSAAVAVGAALRLGKVRLNRAGGTATIVVAAAGTGRLRLTGAGLKRRVSAAHESVRLPVRPTGRAKKRLREVGRAKVKATVAFLPDGGTAIRRSKTIVLRKALSRR